MDIYIEGFLIYMKEVKNISYNTSISYMRDLEKLSDYIKKVGIEDLRLVNATNLNSFILELEKNKLSPATISRTITTIKAFYLFLFKKELIISIPTDMLKAPKVEKKTPETLTIKEIESLLEQPTGKKPKDIRDKAMLELLYATGIRVSELINLKLKDVNIQMNYLICISNTKERVIPFGNVAKKALLKYVNNAREFLVDSPNNDYLFLNCSGGTMSRQGFWKILKEYGMSAGIRKEITPHMLRHSFAAHLVQNGADLRAVQEMMGHSEIYTTQKYLNKETLKIREVYSNSHPRV